MKTAILHGPDWPDDDAALMMTADEAGLMAPFLELADCAPAGRSRTIAILDRTAFSLLHRRFLLAEAGLLADASLSRLPGSDAALVRACRIALVSLDRRLTEAREGDRAGDPAPGPPSTPAIAGA